MKNLPHEQRLALLSVVGWMELGNASEALHELQTLPPGLRAHPDALEIEWGVFARLNRWQDCVRVAEALVKAAPGRVTGWIDRSYALHELKQTLEAWEALLPAAALFEDNSTVPYNLACYACVLGEHVTALKWLECSMRVGDAEEIKLRALEDDDLAGLADAIRRL